MNNDCWIPIRYRDFWDIPRIFLAVYGERLFLFDCPFEEEAEDYPDHYHVYVLSPLGEEALAGSWADLSSKAIQHLGDVPLASVQFDPSHRRAINASILQQLTANTSTSTS
jgi:hypothetical protein